YDGTLTSIRPLPAMAAPDDELLALLGRLSAEPGVTVVVMSGRSIGELCGWFKDPSWVLVGGHGAAWRRGGQVELLLAPRWLLQAIEDVKGRLRALVDPMTGCLFEEKGSSIAIHYRLVTPAGREQYLPRIRKELARIVEEKPGLKVLEGRCVLELSISGI